MLTIDRCNTSKVITTLSNFDFSTYEFVVRFRRRLMKSKASSIDFRLQQLTVEYDRSLFTTAYDFSFDYISRYTAFLFENCISQSTFNKTVFLVRFRWLEIDIDELSFLFFSLFSSQSTISIFRASFVDLFFFSKFVKSLHHKLFCWVLIFRCFSFFCCNFFTFRLL